MTTVWRSIAFMRLHNLRRLALTGLLACSFAASADDWSVSDKFLESSYQVVHVLDWAQTRYIASHPQQYQEENLSHFIGHYPTRASVDRAMAIIAVGHWGVSELLPHGVWRTGWEAVSISITVAAVHHNRSIGVGFCF